MRPSSTHSPATSPRRSAGGWLPFLVAFAVATITALAFMGLVAIVNFCGVGESVKANVVLTCIELSGLLLVILVGFFALFGGDADFSRVVAFEPRRTRACSSR